MEQTPITPPFPPVAASPQSIDGKTLGEKDSLPSLPSLSSPTSTFPLPHISEADDEGRRYPVKKASSYLQKPRAWMGLQPEAPLEAEHDHHSRNHLAWSKVKIALKEPFAEMWGTFILVLFGLGSIAQVSLSKNTISSPDGMGYGSWQSINWGFALGLMLGVYVAGDSGAYLNPAICLTSCVLRKLPWRRLPLYWLAQLTGAFLASLVVYGNYITSINAVEGYGIRTVGGDTSTAGIFATYPTGGLGDVRVSQFFEQFLASAILNFVIYALQDDSNKGNFVASGAWFPLGLFFLMFGIGSCFGWQTGFAINPARDLGPRLMSFAVGYGTDVWTANDYYFWIPIVAPFAGCLVGGILYDLFIFTGESPINTPWMGLKQLMTPHRAIRERIEQQKEDGLV